MATAEDPHPAQGVRPRDHRPVDEEDRRDGRAHAGDGARPGPAADRDPPLLRDPLAAQVDKDSREHFEMRIHKRLLDIVEPTPQDRRVASSASTSRPASTSRSRSRASSSRQLRTAVGRGRPPLRTRGMVRGLPVSIDVRVGLLPADSRLPEPHGTTDQRSAGNPPGGAFACRRRQSTKMACQRDPGAQARHDPGLGRGEPGRPGHRHRGRAVSRRAAQDARARRLRRGAARLRRDEGRAGSTSPSSATSRRPACGAVEAPRRAAGRRPRRLRGRPDRSRPTCSPPASASTSPASARARASPA